MGDCDYLDDLFASAYKQPQGGDAWGNRKEWEVNIAVDKKKKPGVPKVKKDFLRKHSPPKRLQKPREVIKNDPQKFISHKKMSKKQMSELVRIYGTKDLGSGLYGDFKQTPAAKKQEPFKPSSELMKKSLTESSIPTPAEIPGELTYANSYSHLETHPENKQKKKKKKGTKKVKSKEPGYTVEGMKFDPLSATERHYHQQQNFVNMDKKNITFNEFNGNLNDSATNIPKDAKKNTFQISSILKSTSKLSRNLNDSMQYSYLFSPKKAAGMDFENESHHNHNDTQGKNSLSLLERTDKPEMTVKLSGGSDIHNFPEWTSLRDNYIQQLQNLNYHQDLVQNSDMVSDISIPNFIGLLIAIRKISFRIVDKYRQVILYNEKHENFKEMNSYIIKMATDVNCINRQPFVNWMGISPIFNTFFAERKIDGTTALFGDRAEKPKGLKFQGEFQNTRNDELRDDLYKELYAKKAVYMRPELLMTTQEKRMVEELGGVVWSAYCTYQEAMHHKRAAAVIEGMTNLDHLNDFSNDNITSINENYNQNNANNNNDGSFQQSFVNDESMLETGGALENPSTIMNAASANYSVVSTFTSIRPMHMKNHLALSWRKWRRLYLIQSGLRNLTEGRIYCIKRKVIDGWQKYSWQNMEFRRLQSRRWRQLLQFTFDGWFQYLFWCRKFNRVLKMANHENMRRVLKRMRIFSIYVHDNRNFKWKQFHMPLIITFRALKDNATINKFVMSKKLQRASQFTFGELNLRQYFFDKWRQYKNVSIATDTVDVALLVWGMRDALNEWKSLAWPRKFKSRRNLRVFKKSRFGRTTTTTLMEGEEDGDYVEKKNEYLWPQQEKHGVVNMNTFTPKEEEDEEEDDEEDENDDDVNVNGRHPNGRPLENRAQSQAQWQLAAFGAAVSESVGGSETGSENSQGDGGGKSVSSKKSWFSNFMPKKSKR